MSKPANKWKLGSISLCEWHNQTQSGKELVSYQLQKSYKSGDEWKTTDNLQLADIPIAIELLTFALKEAKVKQGEQSIYDSPFQ